jgi:hypothetical protein
MKKPMNLWSRGPAYSANSQYKYTLFALARAARRARHPAEMKISH